MTYSFLLRFSAATIFLLYTTVDWLSKIKRFFPRFQKGGKSGMGWGERRKEGRGGENETRSNICETMRWAVEAEEENFFLFRREFIALTRDSRTFRRGKEKKSLFSQFLSSRFPSAFYPPSLSPLLSTNWQRWERNGITLTQTNGEEKS